LSQPFPEALTSEALVPASPAPRFSLIVPCYNEEEAILSTLASLRSLLAGQDPYELIVVNDGSCDGSAELLRQAEEADPSLVVVRHPHRRGYGAALKSGIRRATSEWIVITDADGTYPIHRIPDLVAQAQNVDMVVGARVGADVKYPFMRLIPKILLKRYASYAAGTPIPDINSGLRVFRRSVIARFLRILPDGFSFTTTMTIAMLTNNYEVLYVPISYGGRIGRSKIRPIRDTLNFVQLVLRTGMYFAPLRVFLPVVGVLLAGFAVSLAYDIWILRDLTEKTLILLLFALNTALFALLADMIDKRSGE
jgi:glycosyltransferase involved in cell wall biosynthesis